jgi:hypothetical protein
MKTVYHAYLFKLTKLDAHQVPAPILRSPLRPLPSALSRTFVSSRVAGCSTMPFRERRVWKRVCIAN